MNIRQAERLDFFGNEIFAELDKIKDEMIKSGKKVYNLSVGTPDFEPPKHIMEALIAAAEKPENYKYSLKDMPQMLEAVKAYYKRRFGVDVETDEICSVHGSQEGIGHIGMALCNKGDIVLLPDPGYPIFTAGSHFGEADIYYYPLLRENKFLPKMSDIPEQILKSAKYMIVSYPSNPSGAAAPASMYEELIQYARKYNFIIINDNAYSDIIFDGRKGTSFLSFEGAKEVGVEFFSLSKSFNITGARVSFAVGNKEIINALTLMRSQLDFGMFYPVQYAAVAALTGPCDSVTEQCMKYQERRDALCGGLRKIGWNVPDSEGTMFVWAPIPDGFASSREFCETLMKKTGVICTPGNAFGPHGEGYVRFALVCGTDTIKEIVDVIDKSGIVKM